MINHQNIGRVDLLNDFSRLGESERELALKILDAFGKFGQDQRKANIGAGWR